MIVGIAVETTVVSKEARAVTSTSATVTARRRAGSKRGAGEADMSAKAYSRAGARNATRRGGGESGSGHPAGESGTLGGGLSSAGFTGLNPHHVVAVLALDGPVERDLALVGPPAVPAIPGLKHRALAFSPKSGDGRVLLGAWTVGG